MTPETKKVLGQNVSDISPASFSIRSAHDGCQLERGPPLAILRSSEYSELCFLSNISERIRRLESGSESPQK